MRKPFDTLLAKYLLQMTGDHAKMASVTELLKDKTSWTKFMKKQVEYWLIFHKHWLERKEIKKHVVYYEDLATDLNLALVKLTHFLGISVSSDTLKCVVERSEARFHRKKYSEPQVLYDVLDNFMTAKLNITYADLRRLVENMKVNGG